MLICECNNISEDDVFKALEAGIHPSEIHEYYNRRVVCGSCLDKMHLMYRTMKAAKNNLATSSTKIE